MFGTRSTTVCNETPLIRGFCYIIVQKPECRKKRRPAARAPTLAPRHRRHPHHSHDHQPPTTPPPHHLHSRTHSNAPAHHGHGHRGHRGPSVSHRPPRPHRCRRLRPFRRFASSRSSFPVLSSTRFSSSSFIRGTVSGLFPETCSLSRVSDGLRRCLRRVTAPLGP